MVQQANLTALMAAALLLSAAAAQATEGLAPAGPIGGTDLNQALLPPPGIYPGLVGGGIDLTKYRLGAGADLPGDGRVSFGALGALVVYDQQFLGGQLASSIGFGRQKVCYDVAGGGKNCSEGAMDLYTDVFLWSKYTPSAAFAAQPKDGRIIPYGTALLVGLGVTWPIGEYDRNSPINVGSNFYTISPSMAVTHTAPSVFGGGAGRATQLSARLFYNHYTENKDSDYDTGDTVSVDFSASEIVGNWTLGVTGAAWTQVQDDSIGGVSNGVRAGAMTFGPIVQYDFALGDRPAFVKAKYLKVIAGEYIPQSEGLTVSMGMKF